MVVTLGQQYHVGGKPAVILYTYIINRHAGTPNKTKTKDTMSLDYSSINFVVVRCFLNSAYWLPTRKKCSFQKESVVCEWRIGIRKGSGDIVLLSPPEEPSCSLICPENRQEKNNNSEYW